MASTDADTNTGGACLSCCSADDDSTDKDSTDKDRVTAWPGPTVMSQPIDPVAGSTNVGSGEPTTRTLPRPGTSQTRPSAPAAAF